MKPAVFLCSVVAALGPHGSCDGSSANCTGCSCYPGARSCRAAGCSFEHGRCVATAGPQRCPVKMQGAMPYACRTDVEATKETLQLCNQQRLHPFSSQMFAGAAEFAETMAEYVRHILNQSAAEYPLRFAYYTNWLTDSQVECKHAGQGPYQVAGGGEQLCSMLEWNAGLSEKKLAKYLVGLMTSPDETALAKTFDSVTDFGSETIKSLCESTEKGWPGSVYDPSGAHSSLKELQHEQELGRPYWGVSGGGGAGAGFGISCVGPLGEVLIITGGGGGVGGMSSPAALAAIEAGGGGGGGVSVGEDGPTVGAGAGTGGFGVALEMEQTDLLALLQDLQDPQSWLVSMKLVRDQIRQCHSSGQQLVLRGGGGGGGGFGALMPGEELPQMAFNYGFEFALAPQQSPAFLSPRHDFGEAAFVSCPGSVDHSCSACVQQPVQRRLEGKASLAEGIGAMFQCGSRWASKICKTASFNGTQYGEWGHYESCVCPVSHLFLTKHLPNTSEFQWIKSEKRGSHCFPKQGQLLPSLTEGMIRANCAAWCVVPILSSKHECPLLPGCECLQGISATDLSAPGLPSFSVLGVLGVLGVLALSLALLAAAVTPWRHRDPRRRVTVRELGEEMLKA